METLFCKLLDNTYLCVARVMGVEFCEAITQVLNNSYDRGKVVVLREDWHDLKKCYVQVPEYDDIFPLRYNPEIEVI